MKKGHPRLVCVLCGSDLRREPKFEESMCRNRLCELCGKEQGGIVLDTQKVRTEDDD